MNTSTCTHQILRVTITSFLISMALFMTLSTHSSANAVESLDSIKQKFIGDYELVSYMQYPEAGGEIDMNYSGRLSYDTRGNMAGIGMPRDLPERNAQSSERLSGGFAYWGKVSYDLENSIVIHHVEGSPMVPQWVGGENIRYFEFTDGFLKLSLKNDQGRITGTLTWRKL
ncbi:MAG: hypothetical protein COA96_11705 [SAR86 cluster bacterium]|uniref:Lipocalin-like domain-containing protein n=1 Tax=SAR86 cluster bacterium TaxID=2030880 RepID=A0A2A5AW18_9GAMM|nr:MAG: hypothetical protein COA96_11705 [SAR86 cluster bacterium]